MSQDISQISLNTVTKPTPVRNSDVPAFQQQQLSSSADKRLVKTSAEDTVAVDAGKAIQGDRLQRIESNVAEKTDVAMQFRKIGNALDVVNSHVQALKANLGKIVKNYPPFSIDSKERMEILRSFISLRKEIDSMTIPPPPPQSGEQLKSVIWQDKGLAGLLPGEIATNATDSQVHSAYEQLGNAVQAISTGKQELQQILMTKG